MREKSEEEIKKAMDIIGEAFVSDLKAVLIPWVQECALRYGISRLDVMAVVGTKMAIEAGDILGAVFCPRNASSVDRLKPIATALTEYMEIGSRDNG